MRREERSADADGGEIVVGCVQCILTRFSHMSFGIEMHARERHVCVVSGDCRM